MARPPKDWDCAKDGHIEVSRKIKNAGRLSGHITVTWCMACGKKLGTSKA